MDTVKVEQVIISTKGRRGSGESILSPVRAITEVFDFDGNLIAEHDQNMITLETLLDFVRYRFKGEDQQKVMEWVFSYFIQAED